MQVGKCVFVWALRGRLLDTIHWKSLILEVVPGDPGGEWKLRQGRKAASTEHVIKQVTTVGNWNSVSLGASGKQHRTQISVFSNWGARELGYLSTTSYQSLVDRAYGRAVLSLAFLAWLCRSQCVPQRPEEVLDKWMQMLAFGSGPGCDDWGWEEKNLALTATIEQIHSQIMSYLLLVFISFLSCKYQILL